MAPRMVRLATAIAFGLGLGFALYLFSAHPFAWSDGDAYWLAAQRLRAGDELYAGDMGPATYRYAPWLAWSWVPLTFLPKPLVVLGWQSAMLACAYLACRGVWHHPVGRIVAAYSFPLLVVNAISGNVQPGVVALLVCAPWTTGVAASVKPIALGLLLMDAWNGRWRLIAASLVLAGVLWLPALLHDLSGYPTIRSISHYDFTVLLAAIPRLQRKS